MTNLSIFEFKHNQVRVLIIDNEPWFVAKDLCVILSISNPSQALIRLDADEKRVLTHEEVISLNDNPDTTRLLAVSESGMYALVLSSRKPEAKPFRKWVTAEVLPSIRKSGTYSLEKQQEPLPVDSIRDVVLAVYGHTGIDKYLLASAIANEIGKQRPEYKALTDSIKEDIPGVKVEDKLVRPGQLAEIYETKTGIKLSAQKMNILLADKGLQVKNPSGKNPSWLPTEQGKEYSQMVLDTARGHNKTVQSLQWHPSVVELI